MYCPEISCLKALVLSAYIYVMVFQDQHTLTKWNILSDQIKYIAYSFACTSREKNILLWDGVLVLEDHYIHTSRENKSFETEYFWPIHTYEQRECHSYVLWLVRYTLCHVFLSHQARENSVIMCFNIQLHERNYAQKFAMCKIGITMIPALQCGHSACGCEQLGFRSCSCWYQIHSKPWHKNLLIDLLQRKGMVNIQYM